MKFSVLMSVYKNDNPIHFEKALSSITTDQTLKPNQVVIIFDGDINEEIPNIIKDKELENSNIEFTIIKNSTNKGLAASLNDGLEKCKYEWIARMDADDISVANRFESQVNYIINNPEISVLGGYTSEFEEQPGDIKSIRKVPSNNDEIFEMIKTRNPINHPTVFIKKDDLLEIGGYSTNFGKLEDYKLWVDLLKNNKKFANLPIVLLNQRVGNGFIERRSNHNEIKDWDMLQKYLINIQFITKFKALKNKLYIRVFIYTPGFLKKILYKLFLRSNN